MHAITKLAPLLLAGGMVSLQGCETVQVDETGGLFPPQGVIQGTVTYNGPPPCSQNGHIVGNAVILVFDARNPPPPNGLGVTAANFGVVSGDTLFKNWPVTPGATKICPDANAAPYFATAPYAIAPMGAGQYVIQGFFDYTGDFFATFKFRQLPEATDVGGGYLDINAAQAIWQNPVAQNSTDGGSPFLLPPAEAQNDPNYIPNFLPVPIGVPGPVNPTSLRGIPTYTIPQEGYLATDVPVLLTATLPLARPYFYPEAFSVANGAPLSPIVANAPSSDRPAAKLVTPQNPNGDVDFIPVLSFPQDLAVYAQPSPGLLAQHLLKNAAQTVVNQYQSAFPQLKLNAGVSLAERQVAGDTTSIANPFHMQLGGPPTYPGEAPGGNGGIYVWWNTCDGLPGCNSNESDFIPEGPGIVYRMWPLVVLAKLDDLPSPNQPNPADPESLNAQGSDLTKPVVIIQGITLFGDTFFETTSAAAAIPGTPTPKSYPDLAGNSNLQDHVTVMVRPSTLCLDPRAPDQGGVLVTPGAITNGNVWGPYPPADTWDAPVAGSPSPSTTPGVVIASANVTNPQLATLVNHNLAGATNGLIGGCLPTGRYQVNLVYPTGQAWTTPNETGSCAASEGNTLFTGAGTSTQLPPTFPDPLANGCSGVSPRPVLYSQGTRAVIEITPTTNPNNCKAGGPVAPVPFACTSLCSDPSLDPTTTPPCSKPIAAASATAAATDAGP